ncbi:uncharacterized protein LOC117319277 [Pecten maximus]|uniref:uncharacterized protein LOC117319277 n=1 Tax=Pecten maximus TaxID=6579 RepID=UPI0014585162|nr:uncharacterized protein LOC117319277 [Pecten maximus]
MSTLNEIIAAGKELGYTGEELRRFLKETQDRARDERDAERKFRKAEIEAEQAEKEGERAFKMEAEHARLEAEREARADERAEREHKRKLELHEAGIADDTSNTHGSSTVAPKGPKLPAFEEGKDSMDAYIQRFEVYATAQRWKRDQWGTNLSALLKGKALDVFSRLPVSQALNFEDLKKALLQRFQKTEAGFRKSFRNSRPEGGETFTQFAKRLESYLDRWMDMTGTAKTYDSLKDLMIRDQFICGCNQDLSLFLKERTPSSIQDMAKLADQYVEARGAPASSLSLKNAKTTGSGKSAAGGGGSTTETGRRSSTPVTEKRCYSCGKLGHLSFDCRNKKSGNKVASVTEASVGDNKLQYTRRDKKKDVPKRRKRGPAGQGNDGTELSLSCDMKIPYSTEMPVVTGRIGVRLVKVLRDTGCSGVVVRRSLVEPLQITDRTKTCTLADGSKLNVPIAELEVDTPYLRGTIEAWVLDTPLYDLIVGNVVGAKPPDQPNKSWTEDDTTLQAVETRQQKKTKGNYRPLKVPEMLRDIGSLDELKVEQESDATLGKFRKLTEKSEVFERGDGGHSKIYYHKGILYRKFYSPRTANGKVFRQLVVPEKFRQTVLKLAHESIMAGHLAAKRTASRILSEFYWPGVQADVTRFCRSCDACQRTFPKGRVAKAPLGSMPLVETPFKRVAVDIVGPLDPATDKGNRYILTVVDYATRYPEAVALRGIETERVAEALVDIFSRVGVPAEMLTDQGAQFTSELMKEVSRLLSIRQLTTTPYHPMCNGLVEKFNGTLKQMLRRMSTERPKDWDRFINALLFAYREVPQESLGFSPFEMLYGRTVRGPMMILRELWSKDLPDDEVKTTYQYVMDLREKLEKTCEVAMDNLREARTRQRKQFNKRAKQRDLKPGDKVLVLLPTKANKLLLQWRGPYDVVEKVGPTDYRVNREGKIKVLHINLLRKYVEPKRGSDLGGFLACVMTAVLDESDQGDDINHDRVLEALPGDRGNETQDDVVVCQDLTKDQSRDVQCLIQEFKDVLTDVPGSTSLIEHEIHTTTSDPVRVKSYPLPYTTKEVINEEVGKMLEMRVIEPSTSPYSSPVVMVKKKDGSNRFCIDFRGLNRVTIFDAEPMPNTEDIFARLGNARYFSKLDLSKGYWQVPLSADAKEMTAFTTPRGLFQFRVMPFGLVNAPATFSRLMRKLLRGMDHLDNFIDDIIIYTDTWEKHMDVLSELFSRLRNAGLTARPTKCSIAFGSLSCLGHVVGERRIQLEDDKVQAIASAPRPETKKQVRSFLGLAGFYRRFIPNFAAIAVPLTDLTRKGAPNKVEWLESHERAYATLKKLLTARPVLKLPNLEQDFILRTDASDTGLGAVLLQEEEGQKMPIAYASRKLLPRERNYAVIEKECLGIVWGIQKFESYIYGREFLLETDHQPLSYLNKSKTANARLMRWALLLQPYRFRIRAIKGSDNVGADYLSRI